MMQERAVEVDPSTIMRWVHRYAPELEKRARSYQGCRATSWRVNETYVNVGGKWKYLFCAVDKHGRLIDFMLSDRRPVVPNTFLASSACERSAGHQTLKAFCGWAIDGSMMLRKFADEVWKPSIFPSLKLSTRLFYDHNLKTHILPAFGDVPLRLLTRDSVQKWLHGKFSAGMSWNSVRHLRTSFGTLLNAAEMDELIRQNVVKKTRLPRRVDVEEPPLVSLDDLKSLLQELPDPSRSIAALIVLTGLRIGEMLALR